MHVAGDPGWLTRELLRVCFDYPFNVCKVNMIIGLVPSGNKEAIRFNTHLGFRLETTLVDAHPDGALLLMTMRRGECRYLTREL
jgi:RimJ/RimL family protein N-acetyltransferase